MPKGHKHLTLKQRCQIIELRSMNFLQKDIAKEIGVSSSTISRELKRNSHEEGYTILRANYRAINRRKHANGLRKKMTQEITERIEEYLTKQWSPEQISGRLKLEENISVSHEWIYQYIWKNKQNGGLLYKNLRRSGKKYNKRSGNAGRGRIPNRVDIKERPPIVETKSRIGDWEGDTIIGKNQSGAILSYVDRKSKMVILEKLIKKKSKIVAEKTVKRFKKIKNKCLTITYDNGSEFSKHTEISSAIKAKCYFATPYHSWERGLNEHTNGLVRQYFPKGMDLTTIADEELTMVENLLNDRPRKVLGYRTPREIFLETG